MVNGKVPIVQFNYDSDTYLTNISLVLSNELFGTNIYYTLNGTQPSQFNGILYTTPIQLTQYAYYTVKAIAIYTG